MNNNCKFCQPDGDYWGYDIASMEINTKTLKGKDTNNAKAHLDNYGPCNKKEIVINYSWFGKMNKEFRIPIKYCPICGREL